MQGLCRKNKSPLLRHYVSILLFLMANHTNKNKIITPQTLRKRKRPIPWIDYSLH